MVVVPQQQRRRPDGGLMGVLLQMEVDAAQGGWDSPDRLYVVLDGPKRVWPVPLPALMAMLAQPGGRPLLLHLYARVLDRGLLPTPAGQVLGVGLVTKARSRRLPGAEKRVSMVHTGHCVEATLHHLRGPAGVGGGYVFRRDLTGGLTATALRRLAHQLSPVPVGPDLTRVGCPGRGSGPAARQTRPA